MIQAHLHTDRQGSASAGTGKRTTLQMLQSGAIEDVAQSVAGPAYTHTVCPMKRDQELKRLFILRDRIHSAALRLDIEHHLFGLFWLKEGGQGRRKKERIG